MQNSDDNEPELSLVNPITDLKQERLDWKTPEEYSFSFKNFYALIKSNQSLKENLKECAIMGYLSDMNIRSIAQRVLMKMCDSPYTPENKKWNEQENIEWFNQTLISLEKSRER